MPFGPPSYSTTALPPNQEVFDGVNPPDVSAPPNWAYVDPYGGVQSGPAPAVPRLVDGTGTEIPDNGLPSTPGTLKPLAPPSLSQLVLPRLALNVHIIKVNGYSWNYGGIGVPLGMPLDLGSIATPYPKDYDFTGINPYNEPVPLP